MATIPPELKAKRARRSRLIRKGFKGICDADIVGIFPHQEINSDVITIREYNIENNGRPSVLYTVRTKDPVENVIEIGTELKVDEEGFDYVVAAVSRATGHTEYRPARLFQFEAKHTEDKAVTLGEKRPAPIDYEIDYGVASGEWGEKRTQLTKIFGSSMKQKQQAASVRRAVQQEVLDTMVQTSFTSTSVVAKKDDIKMEDISLLSKPESSILPPAVSSENIAPHKIYPLTMFISKEDMELLKDAAEELLKTPQSEHLEAGWPVVAFLTCPDFAKYHGIKAVGFVLLACQVYVLSLLPRSRSIAAKDFEAAPFPLEFLTKVQTDFLPASYDRGASKKAVPRLFLSSEERDRFAAYTLALALSLSPECTVPITPWQNAFQGFTAKQMENLLKALGCIMSGCSAEEAIRTKSIQVARLLKPPSKDKKYVRQKRH